MVAVMKRLSLKFVVRCSRLWLGLGLLGIPLGGWSTHTPIHPIHVHAIHAKVSGSIKPPVRAKSPTSLSQGIRDVLQSVKSNPHIGIMIRSAQTNEVIFSQQASHLFTPASVLKLFTAVAALQYLGPHFRFSTQLLSDGHIHHEVLTGNLVIRFSGDPALTHHHIDELIGQLAALGVRRILGSVDIDNSVYGSVPYPPGWIWDDLSYSYAAPLSAIVLDSNKFSIHLIPASIAGQHPQLSSSVAPGIVQWINQAVTTATYQKKCPLTIYSDAHNHYRLSGCLNKNLGPQHRTLALRNPMPYAKWVIRTALQNNHIAYQGPIRIRASHSHATVLATHESVPLAKMLKRMLKKSDNLIANSLFKKLGASYYQQSGTWKNGADALKEILKPTRIAFKENLIDDGAGLSHYNLITPDQLTQLLYYAYHQPAIRAVLMETLPIAGKDGTLVGRMRLINHGEEVRAKTGSMSGVSTLAGYIYTRRHGVLIFAIMINQFVGKNRPFTHLEDRVCQWVAHY